MDVDQVRETWDGVADAWARYEDGLAAFTAPVREALLAELAPDVHGVVLELAAGTGGLSRALAGQAREVLCTDLAPRMVEVARRRAEEAGLQNVTCQVADAQRLPFEDRSVGAVVCQMALMLMPDANAALRESRRVLGTGGRIAAATWGPPQDNLWIVMLGASLLQHGHAVPGDPTGPGGLFSLADPAVLRERFTAAGFGEVRTRTVEVKESFPSFDAFWDLHAQTAGPLRRIIDGLEPQEAAAVRETCRTACEGFRDGGGYTFSGQALVTAAVARA